MKTVMRGLDPRIHLFRMMDCRVEPGNDNRRLGMVRFVHDLEAAERLR
jgi:hypothetical protein